MKKKNKFTINRVLKLIPIMMFIIVFGIVSIHVVTDVTTAYELFTDSSNSPSPSPSPTTSPTTSPSPTESPAPTPTTTPPPTDDPPPASNSHSISSFTLAGVSGVIDETAGTITVTVPYGTILTGQTPIIAHTGINIVPTGEQDFTTSVTYTITAESGLTNEYTVIVTIASSTELPVTDDFDTWDGNGDMTGKIDANHEDFLDLLQDGNSVDSNNYSVGAGSTIITLNEDYLKTLKNGTYQYRAQFLGSHADLTLIIDIKAEIPEIPNIPNIPREPYFRDLTSGPAFNAVQWAATMRIIEGRGGLFYPKEEVSKAQFAVILYRYAGRPPVSANISFDDTAPGTTIGRAVSWVVDNKIAAGRTSTVFGINDNISRESMMVMLYRYHTLIAGKSGTAGADALGTFTDSGSVSADGLDAMRWAAENGLLTGRDNKILPGASITRDQAVTILYRYDKLFNR